MSLESQPNPETFEGSSAQPVNPAGHAKWVLTPEAFDKLLKNFSADPEDSGRQYELMRLKLLRYFEWRSCRSPEDMADETINRVARRLAEGENIFNLSAYFATVARLVFMESLRDRERTSVSLNEASEIPVEQPVSDEQSETRMRCLDNCLSKIPRENQNLILKYYRAERTAKIDLRKQLAESLGIPMNALRIRAHRIRMGLETCVKDCLGQPA